MVSCRFSLKPIHWDKLDSMLFFQRLDGWIRRDPTSPADLNSVARSFGQVAWNSLKALLLCRSYCSVPCGKAQCLPLKTLRGNFSISPFSSIFQFAMLLYWRVYPQPYIEYPQLNGLDELLINHFLIGMHSISYYIILISSSFPNICVTSGFSGFFMQNHCLKYSFSSCPFDRPRSYGGSTAKTGPTT